MATDSALSDNARTKIYLETPPADVNSAAYDHAWWDVFCEWLPTAGLNSGDWNTTIWQLHNTFLYLGNSDDEQAARTLCTALRDGQMPGAAAVAANRSGQLGEFLDGQNDFSAYKDEVFTILTEAYWANVASLAYEYSEFLEAAAHEKSKGQPA